MSDTIEIREFQDRDLGQVLEVLRRALGETTLLRRSPEWFSWKHFRNPFGRSMILVATAGERVVGVRAFMRWDLTTPDGDTLRCVRAVDTATDPDFLRRGIFRRLTTEAVERAAASEIDLIFNTPNPKSGAGYLTMGWLSVGAIGVMGRPSHRLLRRSTPADPIDPSEFVVTPVRAENWQQDRLPLGLRTPRSDTYQTWRFQQHPTATYLQTSEAGSTAILRPNVRNRRRELVLSELMGPAPRRALRRVIASSRADYIAAWFSKGSPERRAAITSGIVPIPGRVALDLVARPLRDLPVDVASLASWDLSLSDLELL